jgi:hypothetical protein
MHSQYPAILLGLTGALILNPSSMFCYHSRTRLLLRLVMCIIELDTLTR